MPLSSSVPTNEANMVLVEFPGLLLIFCVSFSRKFNPVVKISSREVSVLAIVAGEAGLSCVVSISGGNEMLEGAC